MWNMPDFNKFWVATFNFGTNLGQTDGKCFLKIIFDIKIEIGILKILDVPDFDKFWVFLILEIFWT